MTALAPGAGALPAPLPAPRSDGRSDGRSDAGSDAERAVAARRGAEAVDALDALALRARAAAERVAEQLVVHRELLALDWHGSAATAFTDVVEHRVAELRRTGEVLLDLADAAGRRSAELDAQLGAQVGLRLGGGAW